MTFTVYYTDRDQPDSTAIDRAWHNSRTNTLVLELHGVVYEYYDVAEWVYGELVGADSPGNYYRTQIRGTYRGNRLGPIQDMIEQRIDRPDYAFQSGTPKRATVPVGTEAKFYGVEDGPVKVNDLTQVERVPLKVKAAAQDLNVPVTYEYTMQFVISDDGNESAEREHTLNATSLDDAIEQMFDFGELFNQNLVLKGASVRF